MYSLRHREVCIFSPSCTLLFELVGTDAGVPTLASVLGRFPEPLSTPGIECVEVICIYTMVQMMKNRIKHLLIKDVDIFSRMLEPTAIIYPQNWSPANLLQTLQRIPYPLRLPSQEMALAA